MYAALRLLRGSPIHQAKYNPETDEYRLTMGSGWVVEIHWRLIPEPFLSDARNLEAGRSPLTELRQEMIPERI